MTTTAHWKTYLALSVAPFLLASCVEPYVPDADPEEVGNTQSHNETAGTTIVARPTDAQIAMAATDWRTCENSNSVTMSGNPNTLPVNDLYVYDVGGVGDDMDNGGAPKSNLFEQMSQMPVTVDEQTVVIINGEAVLLATDYPFMVQLRVDLTDGYSLLRGQCGGTLISDQWIMTAAHCVDVQFGQDRYNSSLPAGSAGVTLDLHEVSIGMGSVSIAAMEPTRIKATKALCHSGYNVTGNLENDIALIRLETPIDVTSDPAIAVATLPTQGGDGLDSAGGAMLKPMGYGKTETGGTSDNLMIVTLTLDPSQTQPRLFTTQQYNDTAGICSGDSGGPIINDYPDIRVLGLSSFVRTPNPNSCNFPEIPSSFTRVAYYRDSLDAALAVCTDDDTCF